DLLDSFMTRALRDLALVAKLMGVRTVVAGAGPEIAITLVEMGLEIPGVETALNLERALEYLFAVEAAEAAEEMEIFADDDGDDDIDAESGSEDDGDLTPEMDAEHDLP